MYINCTCTCTCTCTYDKKAVVLLVPYSWKISLFNSLCLIQPFIVPPPNVTVTPRSVEEYYNQSVSLECQIDSLTKPMVNWSTTAKVDLDQIQKDVTMTTGYMYVSTLVLSQITLDHTGEYTCSAQNEGGSDSDTASVNVLGK